MSRTRLLQTGPPADGCVGRGGGWGEEQGRGAHTLIIHADSLLDVYIYLLGIIYIYYHTDDLFLMKPCAVIWTCLSCLNIAVMYCLSTSE